jgi:hypothetical protein
MPVSSNLPGLDRLIAVCQQHSLPLELSPPQASVPQPGGLVFGEPLDPHLAEAYQGLGSAEFGPLTLFGPHSGERGLFGDNEELRKYDWEPARSMLIFGKETGFAYYHGTVPRLANRQGLQPVVHIDCHEAIYVFPIASSVDRFFYLYSRYLELLVADPGYGQPFAKVINFPWGMTPHIAQDEPLMEQVLAGRFDFLVERRRDALEWLHELRTARR